MARRGNNQKHGQDHHISNHKKKGSDFMPVMKGQGKASEVKVFHGEEVRNGNQASESFIETASKSHHADDEYKSKEKCGKPMEIEKNATDGSEKSTSFGSLSGDFIENISPLQTGVTEEKRTSSSGNLGPKRAKRVLNVLNGLHISSLMENIEFSDNVVVRYLRDYYVFLLKAMTEVMERQKPYIFNLKGRTHKACDHVRMKIKQAYPIVRKLLVHVGNIMLLLSLVWLDCTLRGIDSFLRMGTTSFFSIIWCSILSVTAMVGVSKFLIVLVSCTHPMTSF